MLSVRPGRRRSRLRRVLVQRDRPLVAKARRGAHGLVEKGNAEAASLATPHHEDYVWWETRWQANENSWTCIDAVDMILHRSSNAYGIAPTRICQRSSFPPYELRAAHRRKMQPAPAMPPIRLDYVSLKYGECVGIPEACPAPIEVQ